MSDHIGIVLRYDKETGSLTWLTGNRAGQIAGTLRHNGYVYVCCARKNYAAHRIAWFLTYGRWPNGDIDHINHDRADNRISNLREVSRSENMENQVRARSNNKIGILGVSEVMAGNCRRKKFRASICKNGKLKTIGYYETPEQASEAYLAEKAKLHISTELLA